MGLHHTERLFRISRESFDSKGVQDDLGRAVAELRRIATRLARKKLLIRFSN